MRKGKPENRKSRIDMSAAAVTARVKLACRLGDLEMFATRIREAVAEISTGKTNAGIYPRLEQNERK
jgi:hypothetical protein